MSKNSSKKKKVQKGEFGYFKAEKKRRLLITIALFAVPLFIFFTAWIYHGSRLTIWTVVATVGCLPACKSMVSLIMILMRRPCLLYTSIFVSYAPISFLLNIWCIYEIHDMIGKSEVY